MRSLLTKIALGGSMVLAVATAAPLLTPTPVLAEGAKMLSEGDQKFVTDAAMGGTEEVKMAQIALNNAGSDSVKMFAQHMIDDHTKVNTQLMDLAKGKGLTVSPMVDPACQAKLDKMSKLTGPDFDKEYVPGQIGAHAKMEAMYMKASKESQDSDLKAWAGKTLPAVQDHLKMAKDIAMKMK